ncbi:MAG: rhomboid protease GluP [Chloroflexota bacterium]|jgi:rhomboid protease GluP|nr:rhomboid protease GluP [Chloroflexota bacterium]
MDPTGPDLDISPARDPRISGPLDRDTAVAYLSIADRLLAAGDFDAAAGYYQRVIGFDDPTITAAAILGLGNALYRLDRDDQALATWREVLKLGETPSAYPAWRQIAAELVRSGKLVDAVGAYREADRRAPPEDKPEIASRLGWLAKETGDPRGARRYFAKSRRQTGLPIPLTYLIVGLTVIVSLAADVEPRFDIVGALGLDRSAVAAGEWWRLLTVTLVHAGPLHLALNMYALYLVGPIVERIYGWKLFGLMYLLCALSGSAASLVFGAGVPSVGASGAIFGLFGVVLAATRIHDPILDRQSRRLVSQVGTIVVLNLILNVGFNSVGGNVDIGAHLGGLAAGLWLGFILVPGNVRSVRDLWQMPAGTPAGMAAESSDRRVVTLVRFLAIVALLTVIVVAVGIATERARSTGGLPELALRPLAAGVSGAGSR